MNTSKFSFVSFISSVSYSLFHLFRILSSVCFGSWSSFLPGEFAELAPCGQFDSKLFDESLDLGVGD